MEENTKKCSLENHSENRAVLYCYDCKIYMCNKCENHHSELFKNHHQIKLDKFKNINEIFTGICKEKNHPYDLKYFCKDHNKLCCAECITKFKGKEHGQHSECNVCSIEDIENEKKSNLKENISRLNNLSESLEQSIEELKKIFEKLEKSKEEIKINIQTVFTKLRTAINDREDELLSNVDKEFNTIFYNENIIKEIDKLPNKVKNSLIEGKSIDNNWGDNNRLNFSINGCLIIENNINEMNKINLNMAKFKSIHNEITFIYTDDENNNIMNHINNLGLITGIPNSEIITKNDFIKINGWIGGNNHFILKYNAKNDGCDTNIFHKKCDDINGCIILCKVDFGDIIGGYISTKIQKKGEFSDDNKAFLFNLTKNILKKNKKGFKNAIKNFADSSAFIKFGSDCRVLEISGNCLNDSKSYADTCSCQTNFDCESTNLFNAGSGTLFKVENFEIFQIV